MRSILSLGSVTSNPKTTLATSVVTPTGNIVASGGTVTTGTDSIGEYKIHTFTSNGTFDITQCYEGSKFEILIVGAGSSGWNGGVAYFSNKELSVGQNNIVVGQHINYNFGQNSSFNNIVATGGTNGIDGYGYVICNEELSPTTYYEFNSLIQREPIQKKYNDVGYSISGTEQFYGVYKKEGFVAPGNLNQNGIVIIKYYTSSTSHKIFIDGGIVTSDENYTYHTFRNNSKFTIDKLPPDEKCDILINHVITSSNVGLVTITGQKLEYKSEYEITGLTNAARGKITGISMYPSSGTLPGMLQDNYQINDNGYKFLTYNPIERTQNGDVLYKVPVRIWNYANAGGAKASLILLRDGRNMYIKDFVVDKHGYGYNDYGVYELSVYYDGPIPTKLQGYFTVDGNTSAGEELLYWPLGIIDGEIANLRFVKYPKSSFDIKISKKEYSSYIKSKHLQTYSANLSISNDNSSSNSYHYLTQTEGYQSDWYDDTLLSISDYGQHNFLTTNNRTIFYNAINGFVSNTKIYSDDYENARIIVRYKSHIQGHILETPVTPETTDTGSILYDTPGTHYWICPENVYSVSVVVIGGGGSGGINYPNEMANGGGGGALAWKNNIPVTPGKKYLLKVGYGGKPNFGDYFEYDESGTTYKQPEDMPNEWLSIHSNWGQGIWPAGTGQGGRKSFFIDDNYVCAGGGAGGTGGTRSYTTPNGTTKTSPQIYSTYANNIVGIICNNYVNAEQSSKFNNYEMDVNGNLVYVDLASSIRTLKIATMPSGNYELATRYLTQNQITNHFVPWYLNKYGSVLKKLHIKRSSGGLWVGDGGANGSSGGVSTQNTSIRLVGEGGDYKLSPYTYGINPLDWYNYSGGGGGAGGYGNLGKAGGGSAGSNYTKTNVWISVNDKRSPANTILDLKATPGYGGGGTSPYGLTANGVNGLIDNGGTEGSQNNYIIMQSLDGGDASIKRAWPTQTYFLQGKNSWWPGKGGKYGGGSGGNGLGGYDGYRVVFTMTGLDMTIIDSNMGQGDSGGDGCVRIIWGPNRSFPSTNTASP